jgi:hypothetical protein
MLRPDILYNEELQLKVLGLLGMDSSGLYSVVSITMDPTDLKIEIAELPKSSGLRSPVFTTLRYPKSSQTPADQDTDAGGPTAPNPWISVSDSELEGSSLT